MIIDRPGVYGDISHDRYHADDLCAVPTLSSSLAKLLITRTPRHCFTASPRLNPNFERDEESKFDIGNAAHAMMLHDERAFCIVDADDWRTNAAKALRDEGRRAGKIPLLRSQFDRVRVMVADGGSNRVTDDHLAAGRALRAYLRGHGYSPPDDTGPQFACAWWNDAPERTAEEVIAALEAAARQ